MKKFLKIARAVAIAFIPTIIGLVGCYFIALYSNWKVMLGVLVVITAGNIDNTRKMIRLQKDMVGAIKQSADITSDSLKQIMDVTAKGFEIRDDRMNKLIKDLNDRFKA